MKTAGTIFAIGALLLVAGLVTAIAQGSEWTGPIIFLTGLFLCLVGGAWLALIFARRQLARR